MTLGTGAAIVSAWRAKYPSELCDVPYQIFVPLESAIDDAILGASTRGNVPRDPIPEDGKRGARTPKR